MARNVLGHFGEILYLLIIIIGIVTTVCAEIIAISSIFVFDIYKTYIFVRIFNTSSFLCIVLLFWNSFFSQSSIILNRKVVCCVEKDGNLFLIVVYDVNVSVLCIADNVQ